MATDVGMVASLPPQGVLLLLRHIYWYFNCLICISYFDVVGVMGGSMGSAAGMVGMGNPMVPPYGTGMQNQMGAMGMGPQVIYYIL